MVHRYFHLQSENTLNTYSYTCSVICECYQNGMKCHVTIGANAIALSDLRKGKNNDRKRYLIVNRQINNVFHGTSRQLEIPMYMYMHESM